MKKRRMTSHRSLTLTIGEEKTKAGRIPNSGPDISVSAIAPAVKAKLHLDQALARFKACLLGGLAIGGGALLGMGDLSIARRAPFRRWCISDPTSPVRWEKIPFAHGLRSDFWRRGSPPKRRPPRAINDQKTNKYQSVNSAHFSR